MSFLSRLEIKKKKKKRVSFLSLSPAHIYFVCHPTFTCISCLITQIFKLQIVHMCEKNQYSHSEGFQGFAVFVNLTIIVNKLVAIHNYLCFFKPQASTIT